MKIIDIFLWSLTIIFFIAIINLFLGNIRSCGYDEMYDNCEIIK